MPVDVDAALAPAFGLSEDLQAFASGWHSHEKHQLLYAATGTLVLETQAAEWLLPPQRAAWITAGTRHRVRARSAVQLRTVYLSRRLAPAPPWECRVFSVGPLAREMVLYAMRWDHRVGPRDALARTYFATLAALSREWVEERRPYELPVARSVELRRATAHVLAHLDAPLAQADVARAAGMSTRTLARRFEDELRLSFRSYVHTARMLTAMDRLSEHGARVTDVALGVGFRSLGAFSSAFAAFAQETPRAYLARARRR